MHKHFFALTLALSLFIGAIGGVAGENIARKYVAPQTPQIAVVDLKALVLEQQGVIMKKYPSSDNSDATKKAITESAEIFAKKLTEAISQISQNHILLVKDAVVGHTNDLTDQIRSMVNNQTEQK